MATASWELWTFGVTVLAMQFILAERLAAETAISGRVVEFKSTRGIADITVKIKRTSDDRVIGTAITSRDGAYSVKLSEDPPRYHVTYDVPERSDFDPAGRQHVIRAAPAMDLDTMGLTNKKSGSNDPETASAHAQNTQGYVAAGGDARKAREAVSEAMSRFGPQYRVIGQQLGLEFTFQRRGLGSPF